jgi:hypothetical protein
MQSRLPARCTGRDVAALEPLDLIGEFAPLNCETEQHVANLMIGCRLRDPMAFQRAPCAI